MAKGYWVVTYRSVTDPDALTRYAAQSIKVVASAGGRFIVRGGQVSAREHGLEERTIVVEFPDYDVALATYEDPTYQEAAAILDGGAVRDFRIVEGVG